MKLDRIAFATLLNWMGRRGLQLDKGDIEDIDNLIDVQAPEAQQKPFNIADLSAMMLAMRNGQKIEAIKAHRSMTGYGLKDSKDWVEEYWINHNPRVNVNKIVAFFMENDIFAGPKREEKAEQLKKLLEN